ncbi:MAG: hypothetical protein IJ875_00430 [Solobacterium sp.]|nr:hypothetical protein [Solobacterium sp.]
MGSGFKKRGGIKVQKDESTLEALQSRIPYWIHETREDDRFFSGKVTLRECTCSVCGYLSRREVPICPQCRSQMRGL